MSQMFKIFVGNVNFKTTEDQLKEVFEPHITIEDLVIARDDEGKSKGYGFVMTRDKDEGRKAMRMIGKFELDDRLVYLKESHGGKKPPKKPRRGPGGPGGRGGFGGSGGSGGSGGAGGRPPRRGPSGPPKPAFRNGGPGPSRGGPSSAGPRSGYSNPDQGGGPSGPTH